MRRDDRSRTDANWPKAEPPSWRAPAPTTCCAGPTRTSAAWRTPVLGHLQLRGGLEHAGRRAGRVAAKVRPGVPSCSWTPDTTSRRPSALATRSRPSTASTSSMSRPSTVSRSRTSCSARTCSPVTRRSAAGCARSSHWAKRSGLLGVGDRHTAGGGSHPRQRAADQLRRGFRPGEDQSDRRVVRRRHAGLHRRQRLLVNPLVFEGYPSIGCAPCTAKPVEGADPRSGRWQGLSKTECGLHAS